MPTRSYAILGAASAEYSVAYFGFDSAEIMNQFVTKYNNFIVEVDQKRKYTLEVSRAWYQPMPSIIESGDSEAASKLRHESEKVKIEQLDDFEKFKQTLAVKKPTLLPLEVQI